MRPNVYHWAEPNLSLTPRGSGAFHLSEVWDSRITIPQRVYLSGPDGNIKLKDENHRDENHREDICKSCFFATQTWYRPSYKVLSNRFHICKNKPIIRKFNYISPSEIKIIILSQFSWTMYSTRPPHSTFRDLSRYHKPRPDQEHTSTLHTSHNKRKRSAAWSITPTRTLT